MSRLETVDGTRRAESIVNRAYAVGAIALVALVVIALAGGEAAATAAVAGVGGIVAALVKLATKYLCGPNR
ncbi:hypothetical protein [Micromonospora tulbaghiae]|uniref:hypothetical protein n=1 Tax=Micromonospora tulbaghiae TaxID=479978 RepID=UPI003674C4E6